jgi:TonB family protein
MRSAIFAALALSPVLLHAQAMVPAQPKAATVLHAGLAEPKPLAAETANRGTATPAKVRVSTGVVAPKLVHTVALTPEETADWHSMLPGVSRKVVVSLVVDKTGTPRDLKIAASASPELDRNVLNAVSQYRFTPGTVSNQPTEVPVNLEIEVVNRLAQ